MQRTRQGISDSDGDAAPPAPRTSAEQAGLARAVVAMQRSAGNAATASMVGQAVQRTREEEDGDEPSPNLPPLDLQPGAGMAPARGQAGFSGKDVNVGPGGSASGAGGLSPGGSGSGTGAGGPSGPSATSALTVEEIDLLQEGSASTSGGRAGRR